MSMDVNVLFYLGTYFIFIYTHIYLYETLERYTLKCINDFSDQEFEG